MHDADELEGLRDRLDVREMVDRAASACDARDWALARACYADRVRLDYQSLSGEPAAEVGADEMVAGWRKTLGGFDHTQHLIGNHLIAIDGDAAVCRSQFRAQHRIGEQVWELSGHYRHDLRRSPSGGWLIEAQTMTWTFQRGDRALMDDAARRTDGDHTEDRG